MKVLLRSDVKGIGRRGDIVEVKAGYARNFLLPTGAALEATDTMAAQAEAMRKNRDLRDAKDKAAAETQRTALESAKVVIEARAGNNGRLFGSITEVDVANALSAKSGVSVDRHQVVMAEHVKETGPATVEIRLIEGVTATVTIDVTAKA